MKHFMSELTNLLNQLRQTAGLPGGGVLSQEAQSDTQGKISQRPLPGASDYSKPTSVPAEAELLLGALSTWAGVDPKRWDRMLRELKHNWQPTGWVPDSLRDLLVAWTAANFRLVSAQGDRQKLEQLHHLTRGHRIARHGRDADISFYSRLATWLQPRAVHALQQDAEAFGVLERLCVEADSGSET